MVICIRVPCVQLLLHSFVIQITLLRGKDVHGSAIAAVFLNNQLGHGAAAGDMF